MYSSLKYLSLDSICLKRINSLKNKSSYTLQNNISKFKNSSFIKLLIGNNERKEYLNQLQTYVLCYEFMNAWKQFIIFKITTYIVTF